MPIEAASQGYAAYERGGVIALLILALVFMWCAFMWEWIVPGSRAKELKDDAKGWKTIAEGHVKSYSDIATELRELRLSGRRDGS